MLSSTYDANLPPVYTEWVGHAFGWTRIEWTSFLLPTECAVSGSGFRSQLLATALVPLGFICFSVLVGVGRQCAHGGMTRHALLRGLLKGLPAALAISFIFVPSVSMTVLRTLASACTTIAPPFARHHCSPHAVGVGEREYLPRVALRPIFRLGRWR